MSDTGNIAPNAPRGRPFAPGKARKPRGTRSKSTQLMNPLFGKTRKTFATSWRFIVEATKNAKLWEVEFKLLHDERRRVTVAEQIDGIRVTR